MSMRFCSPCSTFVNMKIGFSVLTANASFEDLSNGHCQSLTQNSIVVKCTLLLDLISSSFVSGIGRISVLMAALNSLRSTVVLNFKGKTLGINIGQ